jgi:glycosyltransferase involved in cell wall biosynthesis
MRILALTHCDSAEVCTLVRLDMPLCALQANRNIEYELVTVTLRPTAALRRALRDIARWDIIWVLRPSHYSILPFIYQARHLGKPMLVDLDDWLLGLPAADPDAVFMTRSARETMRLVLRASTAVTTSSKVIAERCAALGVQPHVLPNAIDSTRYARNARDADLVTIAYCGSPSHQDDIYLITAGLRELLRAFPGRVRVISLGCPIPELDGHGDYVHYAHVAATDYPRVLSELCIDIGLAPLRDTDFNRAKSDIKYLEYSATGAATIASPVTPYLDSVNQNRGDLLSANTPEAWSAAMRRLVEEPQVRRRLATNAYEWVHRERSIEATAHKWLTVFRDYADRSRAQAPCGRGPLDRRRFRRATANIVLRQFPHDVQQVRSVSTAVSISRRISVWNGTVST